MRCPDCGATNPDTARWCGQCLRRFSQPSDPPAEVPRPSAGQGAVEGFRRRGEALEWACPACQMWNPITVDRCPVCGSSLTDRFTERRHRPEHEIDERVALALSAVVPGAGHLAARRYGSGTARALLFVVWLLGGLGMLGAGGRRALPAAVPLLAGAGLLWAGSLLDVLALHRGGRQLLGARVLLWLVVGVTALSALALFGLAQTGGR